MKLYLDTNILAFLITGQKDEISYEVSNELSDYSNVVVHISHTVGYLYQFIYVSFLLHFCNAHK